MDPTYTYKCPRCKEEKDVRHPYEELDNLSDDTQIEVSCNEITCPLNKLKPSEWPEEFIENPPEYGLAWKRVITMPHLGGMSGGTSVTESELLAKKQQGLKQRSRKHFKDEVLKDPDGLVQNDKDAKRHFEKKYGK